MPSDSGEGFVDYVLRGDDGKPLALVEAKRTRKDPRVGQQQAKLYADCLEAQYGQRPIIFYSNGYEHWIWDDTRHPPRPIQGFLKKDELALMIQRRTTRKPLAPEDIDRDDRRALLSAPRHPPRCRGLRARQAAQGAAGDGDRRRQDPHGDRARRSADAGELGQARAVPRRSQGAGEAGRQRLQGASARRRRRSICCDDKTPGGPRLRLDLSDHDGPDRRGRRRADAASASAISTSS